MPKDSSITVLIPEEGESWAGFLRRLRETKGDLLAVLSGRDDELEAKPEVRAHFLKEAVAMRDRLRLATKQPQLVTEARQHGLRVLDRTKYLRLLLKDHEKLSDALRVFSPHLWRQQIKSRLQRIGHLSIPKMRISFLLGLSGLLFFFVMFRLLPSAEISVKPREETVSQAMNILLLQSGATIEGAARVRRMPLFPITVRLRRALMSNSISKEFIGTSAHADMTIINASDQTYSLRKGTRVTNQAGMVFKLQDAVVNLEPRKNVTIRAKAEDLDLYGQIIGDRGNVPAGLRWEIPGLAPEERKKIYAENRKPGVNGVTAYRSVLRKEDLDIALHRLEQQLEASAKERVEEERVKRNAQDRHHTLSLLSYTELKKADFSGAVLPLDQVGKTVNSFTVETTLTYTTLTYDVQAILDVLSKELFTHVQEGKKLVEDSVSFEHIDVRVISYDDNLSWVKLTAELLGRDRYVLDPLTPDGALFGKRVREKVTGLSKTDALRIVKNMPEVEDADVSVWPPWQRTLPAIPSNVSISVRDR